MPAITRLCAAALTAASLAHSAAPANAAGDSVVDKLRETGEINIGVRRDARPHSYLDADGRPAGLSVEVCTQVVNGLRAQLGLTQLRMNFVAVGAEDRFQRVAEGAVDLHCGAATITLSRREIVDFSIPTFADGASVLTAKGASEDFAALDGKRIGVRSGTTTERALTASLAGLGMTAEVVSVNDHAEGLRAVEAGEIDAYFGDQSILFSLLEGSDAKDRLTVARNVLTLELYGLALPLGDHRFRLEVDRALSRLYETGGMAALFEAAFPGAEPGDSIRYIHTFAPIPP